MSITLRTVVSKLFCCDITPTHHSSPSRVPSSPSSTAGLLFYSPSPPKCRSVQVVPRRHLFPERLLLPSPAAAAVRGPCCSGLAPPVLWSQFSLPVAVAVSSSLGCQCSPPHSGSGSARPSCSRFRVPPRVAVSGPFPCGGGCIPPL